MITDDMIDKLVKSIEQNTHQWRLSGTMIIHQSGIYIGNFDQPNSLVIMVGEVKYGTPYDTITMDQSLILCNAIMNIYNKYATPYAQNIINQL